MDINEIKTKYTAVRLLDKDEKGTIEVVESESRNFVLRTMNGRISSYKALLKISSPYLPKVELAEYENGKTIVVEEYIEGERNIASLTDEKAIISAFCELCDVLTVLHSRGIIHRDIKPSNVLIAPDGHIRLIDLDASRYYDDSKDSDTHYLGTKGYAPPEQFGYSQTNATADIYSLGVTLKNVLGEKAEKRKFSRIIRKCTEFDPKNRYPSAAAVKKALLASNMSFLPMILIGSAAVIAFILYLFPAQLPSEPENIDLVTAAAETSTVSSSVLSETVTTAAASSSTAASSTTTEETTAVPETEQTSETEETTVTAETSASETETSESTSTSSVTSNTTAKPQTTKATTKTSKTTTKTSKTTTSKPKETQSTETTATSKSAPAGTILMTCVTDKLRTPSSSLVKINGKNFDELSEPWTFDPDETMIGTWNYLCSTGQGTPIYNQMYYKKIIKDPMNAAYPKRLRFDSDGTCVFINYFTTGGAFYSDPLNWTYGLIETPAVGEYYFYEHYYLYTAEDGKEYLFLEIKNGDYMNASDPISGIHYMIYERFTEE
ncbi:MAG: protein kinase [Oscillospiraceae bacterium]|nr:protein kinase [Oscillospiraceae bacterium]